jgi:hypothetical protein
MFVIVTMPPQLISEAQLRCQAMSRQREIVEAFQHADEIRRAFGKTSREELHVETARTLRVADEELECTTHTPFHTDKEPDEPDWLARNCTLTACEHLLSLVTWDHWSPPARTLFASG